MIKEAIVKIVNKEDLTYEEAYADKIADVLTDKALYEKVSANAKRDLYKTWDEVTDMINADYVRLTSKSKK